MGWGKEEILRRSVLKSGVTSGILAALAGCTDGTLTGNSPREEEPDERPDPLQDGVDIDALRQRTAMAIAEEAFSVTGVVAWLAENAVERYSHQSDDEGGSDSQVQARSARGNPDAEQAIYAQGRGSNTEIEKPTDANSHVTRYFEGDTVYLRQNFQGDTQFEQEDAEYADFADEVEWDLDQLYDPAKGVEFDAPQWDAEEGVYVIEGVAFDIEATGYEGDPDVDPTLDSCEMRVNANGVVVGISVALDFDEGMRIELEVDGRTDATLSIQEPDWVSDAK